MWELRAYRYSTCFNIRISLVGLSVLKFYWHVWINFSILFWFPYLGEIKLVSRQVRAVDRLRYRYSFSSLLTIDAALYEATASFWKYKILLFRFCNDFKITIYVTC